MLSIRKGLSALLLICSLSAILLITIFVNITINKKFHEYMINTQNKKYERIVSYFQEIYKREGSFKENSGIELIHEAYMDNYCLTLKDSNKNYIWGMDPQDIKSRLHLQNMPKGDGGIYNSKTFEIKVNDEIVGFVDIGQYYPVLFSQEDMSFQRSINESIIASGLVALLMVIAISLYFSKKFSEPIRDVANMSVELSKGDFKRQSDTISSIVELEKLRDSVNVLANKLKYQDTLRKRLISDISHELRTPLNILQNNLEAMIDGVIPTDFERLSYLNDEVIRFGGLINNLNELKAFEEESIKLTFKEVSLAETLRELTMDFYPEAERKGINFRLNIPAEKEFIAIGDKDKLKQLFINLLSNAVKFTPSGGFIEVNLYNKENKIFVEIEDSGVGINKEDLPYVFERLYRGDKSRNQIEGSGLGLTIVRNILKLHQGTIEVESEEGKGSKFILTFIKK